MEVCHNSKSQTTIVLNFMTMEQIWQENMKEFATFVPCSAHSHNLVAVLAASAVPCLTTSFGIVQNLFVSFSWSIDP